MPEPIQLTIRVRLEGGEAFPASFVAQTLGIIETEIFELEQEELEEIFRFLGDLRK